VSIFRKVLEFYKDPDYFSNVQKIAIPIIIQQLMFSGLNMLGVILIGQKGDASVAAVGLAGQIAFLLNLVHFGIISGAAMFTAQFWGKRDIPNLRRVLGLCLILAICASFIFFTLSQLFPSQILHIYSKDPVVIELGTGYIRTFSFDQHVSFLFADLRAIWTARTRHPGCGSCGSHR
jgi:Na+-driven multidrug efflux pump